MRLIKTSTLELVEFVGEDIPEYTILSHTWGSEEVSFQKFCLPESATLDGYIKVQKFCGLAAQDGFDYAWADTCCIDKTSSAELSEAINSMFRWYADAQVCYAYLADFAPEPHEYAGKDCPPDQITPKIEECRWFRRGWTLQELLAPSNVIFYDRNWVSFGTRQELQSQISSITGISHEHIDDPAAASVAQRISWASSRKTTRTEDVAYSLIGLFEVNMPLLYGEGMKAFARLQAEIIRSSSDETIFAWKNPSMGISGILATSPADFAESGEIIRIPYHRVKPYSLTNMGLKMQLDYQILSILSENTYEYETLDGNTLSPTSLGSMNPDTICAVFACARLSDPNVKPYMLILDPSNPKDQGAVWRLHPDQMFFDKGAHMISLLTDTFYLGIKTTFEDRNMTIPGTPSLTSVERMDIKLAKNFEEQFSFEPYHPYDGTRAHRVLANGNGIISSFVSSFSKLFHWRHETDGRAIKLEVLSGPSGMGPRFVFCISAGDQACNDSYELANMVTSIDRLD
ncbi:uncharacterized protein KY384_001260 [Bacidia gigantensis]|uniref:uncharacterized protein n=1 Tax=Bacidia gigantensis TaxID=2732470 RepID=UPI001D041C52|nr:uncharacterized protein KY384_001260 [Bacidia gigantensis]KAG8534415.1 hypothetical protein KY384_001260 [Bacidia gigantensis]